MLVQLEQIDVGDREPRPLEHFPHRRHRSHPIISIHLVRFTERMRASGFAPIFFRLLAAGDHEPPRRR
jgi:hypothetical protein